MKNWKTTLLGLLGGGTISIDGIIHQGLTNGWHQAIVGLVIALIGFVAKDWDVTGGTKKQ